jgi:hypothetical protein
MRVARIEWRVVGEPVQLDADRPLHESRGWAHREAEYLAREFGSDTAVVDYPSVGALVERSAVLREGRTLAWVVLRVVGSY